MIRMYERMLDRSSINSIPNFVPSIFTLLEKSVQVDYSFTLKLD